MDKQKPETTAINIILKYNKVKKLSKQSMTSVDLTSNKEFYCYFTTFNIYSLYYI